MFDVKDCSETELIAYTGLQMLNNEQAIKTSMLLVHETASNAGWYVDLDTGERKARNYGEVIALMHSELSEALEADRKNLTDSKLPHYHGTSVELVDCMIRIFDTVVANGFADKVSGSIYHFYADYWHKPSFFNFPARLTQVHEALSAAYAGKDGSLLAIPVIRIINLFKDMKANDWRDTDYAAILIEKNRFNRNRADHKLENRAGQHGKRY